MKIVQLVDNQGKYLIAKVSEPDLILINNFENVYDLAILAIESHKSIITLIEENISENHLDYDEVYYGKSDFKLSLPIFHPKDPRFCMVAGTGLTHKASAENRNKMHEAATNNQATDSMKMYQIGVEGGKPASGNIGAQPEWFYKGNGSVLRAHNEHLTIPNYGNDGGEEPEIAAIYINDKNGFPHRIGFTTGNEFSDHVMEKKNYLYLAPSKIRNCSIGPELVLTDKFEELNGKVLIKRNAHIIWEKSIGTGENNMCHSLQNLEYHHFKYDNHRIPGDLNIHFLGTVGFSFGAGIVLEEGDEMIVSWENMGRPLVNFLKIDNYEEEMISIKNI
ncbi:MAG: AraD1 family protein [Bacteroidota bacterium]